MIFIALAVMISVMMSAVVSNMLPMICTFLPFSGFLVHGAQRSTLAFWFPSSSTVCDLICDNGRRIFELSCRIGGNICNSRRTTMDPICSHLVLRRDRPGRFGTIIVGSAFFIFTSGSISLLIIICVLPSVRFFSLGLLGLSSFSAIFCRICSGRGELPERLVQYFRLLALFPIAMRVLSISTRYEITVLGLVFG